MKRLILTIIAVLCLTVSVQAAGLTIWGLTEQLTTVEADNSLTGRVGYFLGIGENGGLEPFIGSVWRPRIDDVPQVITLGAVQHLSDLVDPNNSLPYIPDFFVSILNEDTVIRPYIGAQFTINFVDRDSGFIGFIGGVTVKLEEDARSELVFELGYNDTFNALAGVPDNEISGYLGFRIPF